MATPGAVMAIVIITKGERYGRLGESVSLAERAWTKGDRHHHHYSSAAADGAAPAQAAMKVAAVDRTLRAWSDSYRTDRFSRARS